MVDASGEVEAESSFISARVSIWSSALVHAPSSDRGMLILRRFTYPSHGGTLINIRSLKHRAKARIRRDIDAHRMDVEIRQLRSLRKAYASSDAPEILVIGDSTMMWVARTDPDQRTLIQMVKEHLPGSIRIHAFAGPGYNPRIASVYLEALMGCPGRPRITILPTSLLMASTAWISHPVFSYIRETPELRRIANTNDATTRHLPRATKEDWEEWDRQPLPSLFGARRTRGEARLIMNTLNDPPPWATPTTPWQRAIRMRHMLDVYTGEKLTPESPGVKLLAEMGRLVNELAVPSIAPIPPVDRDVLVAMFKEPVIDHVRSNVEVMSRAFLDAAGTAHSVVDASLSCTKADFGDPVHLNSQGRRHFAELIAAEILTQLQRREA